MSDFPKDKKDTLLNLESIRMTLVSCINAGMLDDEFQFYNELIGLIDEVHLVKTYPELAEVITKAKTLEADIDAWLSSKHRETLSIAWAKVPK